MTKLPFNRLAWLMLRASTALVLTIAPYHMTWDGSAKLVPATAHAESEGGGGGGGDGGHSGGGGGDGGHDGGDGGDHDGGDHDGGDGHSGGGAKGGSGTTGSHGSGDDQGDDNDDQGENENEGNCGTDALTQGTIVKEAELRLTSGGAVFKEIELGGKAPA